MKASKRETAAASKATRNIENIDFRVKMVKTKGSELLFSQNYMLFLTEKGYVVD